MKEDLIYYLDCEVQALRKELELTRKFIYREYRLKRDISPETTQDLINAFIRREKEDKTHYYETL